MQGVIIDLSEVKNLGLYDARYSQQQLMPNAARSMSKTLQKDIYEVVHDEIFCLLGD